MEGTASWQNFFSLLLAGWRERGEGRRGTLPAWCPEAVFERLEASPIERRGELLELLRERSGSGVLDRVHPSWVALQLPADPLLCRWALMSLPTVLRQPVAALAANQVGDFEPGSPPPWFAGWWRQRLARSLDYPVPLPWNHSPGDPLSWLWRLEVEPLSELLLRYGLRPLAAVFAKLEAPAAARLVYAVTPALRSRLVGYVRRGEHPSTEPWFAVYRQLADDAVEPAELPLHLALVFLATSSAARQRPDDLRRLALRLPVEWGTKLLVDCSAELTSADSDTDADADLNRTVEALVRAGEIQVMAPSWGGPADGQPAALEGVH